MILSHFLMIPQSQWSGNTNAKVFCERRAYISTRGTIEIIDKDGLEKMNSQRFFFSILLIIHSAWGGFFI